MADPLLTVQNLRVDFDGVTVVDGISFTIGRGECLALVGESGSGKSVTSRSLVGLTGTGARVQVDRLDFDGEDLTRLSQRRWRRVRGARIGFVLQDALSSLDGLRPIGREVAEPLALHTRLTRTARQRRVVELLASVGVPEPEVRARQYPYQLSGGLRQRALIASAIACAPRLLIADEPTTALDATVQAQVLALLETLKTSDGGMLVVSHDLAVVARLADRIAVMRDGVIVEQGPTAQVLGDPRHDYTRALLAAVPGTRPKGTRLSAVPVASEPAAGDTATSASGDGRSPAGDVVEARGLTKSFLGPDGVRRTVVSDVSFTLGQGRTLGIVGESGSGKTTTARMVLGVEQPDAGEVRLHGRDWAGLGQAERRRERRRLQVIYQDPLSSFDPRYTVERVIGEALGVIGHPRGAARRDRTVELLEQVGLDAGYLGRRPLEMSGGQRQRVAIARALAPEPEVIVCDEPVSALDVSVQAQVLDLLADLQQRLGVSYLFISHDLGVIHHVSDQVLVMKDGSVVEAGDTAQIFERPQHAYTRALLAAVPRLHPTSSI
ncbi:ABC transporter ATP-binding protein [Micromonospora sp. NPDC049523]|uniref:ABC transporter ATP-binding protein n=1 Tax=Micromonospora sp. NPDC049523 TaxID=3155921 RepID=UPI003419DDFF